MTRARALRRVVVSALLLLTAARPSSAATPSTAPAPAETPGQRDARMKWFRDARFGMFIHWGLYAIPAGEWKGRETKSVGEWIMEHLKIPASEYEPLARQFNPQQFDARRWAQIAKAAGMKYIVITSKHHDGFALWDSTASEYDVMDASPFKRDILKELADAARAEGLQICWYHSIMDWRHPLYAPRRAWNDTARGEPDMERFKREYLYPQVRELLTNFGPIGIMWFDGEWEGTWTHADGIEMYDFCRSIQPDVIVNNRVDKGREGMKGHTKAADGGDYFRGDYGTPEQEVPPAGFGPGVDWESCMTMNDTWGFKKNDHNWKSSQQLVRTLIDCASKGGNFLLNVGPTAEGLIPEPSVERLADVGKWMDVNGEAIYGTAASPFKEQLPWGRVTSKPAERKLYLHVFDWPSDGVVTVPMKGKAAKAIVLGDASRQVKLEPGEAGLKLTIPGQAAHPAATVVALELEGDVQPIEGGK